MLDIKICLDRIRYMNTSLTITLPKQEKERLNRLALVYGLSMDELSRRIIAEATRTVLEIPEESLEEYENADDIRRSLRRALRDERRGKLLHSLPQSIVRKR